MSKSTERPPIVVVMGHVDHGKSTLLDFIRKSNIVAGEAGGITQHVAAYEVVHEHEGAKKRITFIDTPGHAAFQSIRARGANVADIAILVVAADDGVKAQTLEALASIREAKIPFIVTINKIDKPNADISRTQASLLEKEVYLEKLGGDVPWVAISAKAGTGVDELLDLILVVAELQEFKGDASVPAEGYVIEAHRDAKRGIAATLIITNGILKSGSSILAGHAIAPVRIMEDHTGKAIREATFSTPITLRGRSCRRLTASSALRNSASLSCPVRIRNVETFAALLTSRRVKASSDSSRAMMSTRTPASLIALARSATTAVFPWLVRPATTMRSPRLVPPV
ncbi:GTP-binding protein, partial [Candidatus Kaiserbacteria bacterium]|nr:GTP-binding protein [Candidatus Kaiserbacteria bacterium]